jgi:hypothetical protein
MDYENENGRYDGEHPLRVTSHYSLTQASSVTCLTLADRTVQSAQKSRATIGNAVLRLAQLSARTATAEVADATEVLRLVVATGKYNRP